MAICVYPLKNLQILGQDMSMVDNGDGIVILEFA